MRLPFALSLVFLVACSNTGGSVAVQDSGDSGRPGPDVVDSRTLPDEMAPDLFELIPTDDQVDSTPDLPLEQCQPGDGCFLDPCDENADCQSGYCVEHLGEPVCSQLCQEECPPGWSCKQVGGAGPDLVFACVSAVANLCRPCASGADCKSPGGAEDVCVRYPGEGSFCGGACDEDEDCPWGFSCADSLTVSGLESRQCVADAGVCPCTANAAKLGLTTPCENANEWGTCHGSRICTPQGLSACDAAVPAPETCDGQDNDCNGDVDEGAFVEGEYVNLCDDQNPCTQDQCSGADGCQHIALLDGECQDGNPCTVADHCDQGVCVGDSVECDDSNPCTQNLCTETGGCEYPPMPGECDDLDPCTLGDHCIEGTCTGQPVACDCLSDADCAPLDDGDTCNGTLVCATDTLPYQCVVDPDTVLTCPAPQGPDAPCLAAACDPESGDCALVPVNDGGPCEDGDLCTLGDTCDAGMCAPGPGVNCNDGNPCTDDACDPGAGCVHTHNQAPCSDSNVCTTQDTCAEGACVPGPALNCTDTNPCTADSCAPDTGCVHEPQVGPCDDSDPCTSDDHCQNGNCVAGAFLSCDDENPCTTDSCAPGVGCTHSLNQTSCDDGDVCTTGDHCHLGECIHAATLFCDDANPCTADSCDAAAGCKNTPAPGGCDDGNPCTQDDQCVAGTCVGGGNPDCDDDNPCTNDTCDPQQGCLYTFNTLPCDDSDWCTTGDGCSQGACVPGSTLDCDDSNPCTDDACDPATGCTHTPNQAACPGGHCEAGECIFDCVPDCAGKQCGDDGCGGSCGGCEEVPNAVCTGANVCAVLQCNSDITCLPHGLVCNTQAGHCVQCRQNGECLFLFGQEKPLCDPAWDLCAECLDDGDCFNETCNRGFVPAQCHPAGTFDVDQPCSENEHCLPGLLCHSDNTCRSLCGVDCKPGVCNGDSGLCEDCHEHADCDAGQVCSDHSCVPGTTCQSAQDCQPPAPACADGVCVECSADQDCLEGFVCAAANTCRKACETSLACDGQVCSVDVGHCVACVLDFDCAAQGKPRCDPDTGSCVECLADADCPDNRFCRQGACLDDVCQPGADFFCVAGKQRLCNESGSGYGPLACADVCCPEGETCVQGECSVWAPTGASPDMAGTSCRQIADDGFAQGDGPYWVVPDGFNGDALQVYCDMTTDGGGWTLVAWTGDTTDTPHGVPYPGLAWCESLDCKRGSGAPPDAMLHILRAGSEFAKAQHATKFQGHGANILSYQYAGKYIYGDLSGIVLLYDNSECGQLLGTATFESLKGAAQLNGTVLYLDVALRYSGYDRSGDDKSYIWNIGVPDEVCAGGGDPPGTWMGTWSEGQYGPVDSASDGAHSVWVR